MSEQDQEVEVSDELRDESIEAMATMEAEMENVVHEFINERLEAATNAGIIDGEQWAKLLVVFGIPDDEEEESEEV